MPKGNPGKRVGFVSIGLRQARKLKHRRFGTPDEFRHLIDRCHQEGIGVIVDWVPGGFPKDACGLAEFDGTQLYGLTDPRRAEHRDWGTLIFYFGRSEVAAGRILKPLNS